MKLSRRRSTTPPMFLSVATLPQVHRARMVYKTEQHAKYVTACGLEVYDIGVGLVVVHKGILPVSCRACNKALDTPLANH